MIKRSLTIQQAALFAILSLIVAAVSAQSPVTSPAQTAPTASVTTPTQTQPNRVRRTNHRRQHTQQQVAPQSSPTPNAAAAQRQRDQQILAAQQEQSAETAKENAAITAKVVHDQNVQQAEPRIQDAPGPGSQPLPGDPAIQPAQTPDPRAIQDAPGPAQTLPTPPPQQ